MHRTLSQLGIAAVAVLVSGCSFAMRPVQLEATRTDWAALAGDWRGHYTVTGRDRHGLIEFRLKALEHEASGDVLMISDRSGGPITGMPPRDGAPFRRPVDSQLLAIQFVAAEHGLVRGNLAPYWDPDRECRAWASFLGSVDGHVITGSFLSVCDDGVRILGGRWRVERRAGTQPAARDPIAQRGPLDVQELGGPET